MNVQTLRALLLLGNLVIVLAIAAIAYSTFGPVDKDRWNVDPPALERFTPPVLGEDATVSERERYRAIVRVFEHEQPKEEAAETPSAPAPPPRPPSVSDLVVRVLQYDVNRPEASSALLYDPRSRTERFFQVGLDLGAPGLGFEQYKGTRVKAITRTEVVLLQADGKEVRLPAPRGKQAP